MPRVVHADRRADVKLVDIEAPGMAAERLDDNVALRLELRLIR